MVKKIKGFYENNITEDIVYSNDTLQSELHRIVKRLANGVKPFFLVVLNSDDKIKGVIARNELEKMIKEANKDINSKIKFKYFVKKHKVLLDSDDYANGLRELKKKENKGFILIKNKEENYVGKLLLDKIINS